MQQACKISAQHKPQAENACHHPT